MDRLWIEGGVGMSWEWIVRGLCVDWVWIGGQVGSICTLGGVEWGWIVGSGRPDMHVWGVDLGWIAWWRRTHGPVSADCFRFVRFHLL